jgi:hypothetical protein
MRAIPRRALGAAFLFLWGAALHGQGKRVGNILLEAPAPAPVQEITGAFPQIVGTQVGSSGYKFSKEPLVIEGAKAVAELGSRIIKTRQPAAPELAQLIGMPFTHYLFWHRAGDVWKDGFTKEESAREYAATYAFAKDLLTRRDTSGQIFFLGHWQGDAQLLEGLDPSADVPKAQADAMVEWLNVRQKAVDDARREVPYSRCQVYVYAEVSRVREAMKQGRKRMADQVLPRVDVDFVSYAAYDCQLLPAPEVLATLEHLSRQLKPKPSLPVRRVFIGECGLPLSACVDAADHERRNREIIAKFLGWKPPLVLHWQLYDAEKKDGKYAGWSLIGPDRKPTPLHAVLRALLAAQEEASKQYQARARRLPGVEEMAGFTEDWLRRPR